MTATSFRHNAFIYESDAQFVATFAPFVDAGLKEGATVLAVTTRTNWSSLRDALGPAAESVRFVNRDSWYVRPARTIASFDELLRRERLAGVPSVRAVAEVQFGPSPDEWDEWTTYESILNRALAEHPAWIVCPYDTRALPGRVVDGAVRTHPEILNGGLEASPDYAEPRDFVGTLDPEIEPLLELAQFSQGSDLSDFRAQLAAALADAQVPESRALDMIIAANEVLANALEHAEALESVRAGVVDGQFVCEISDRGPGVEDPLAGFIPPKPGHDRGRGLWIARQLASRVEARNAGAGFTVRLWL